MFKTHRVNVIWNWLCVEDHVMFFRCQTPTGKRPPRSLLFNVIFFKLASFVINLYTLSPRNIESPTSSRLVDTTVVGTPHFT